MRRARKIAAAALLAFSGAGAVPALETDQFYAWGWPLEDATEILNARINLELDRLVADLNRRGRNVTCQNARSRFFKRHHMLFFHQLETWSANSPLVDRAPSAPGEMREYRSKTIYGALSGLDSSTWMPLSPTIEVNGVRIGTDKLTHMLGTAWYYHRWYRKLRARGATSEEAEQVAMRRGLRAENTILGKLVAGIVSLGDLEANHRGMWFYEHLCAGGDPVLTRDEGGKWRVRRPFDFRDYVTPEWDESYQPNIFVQRKWAKVRPRLLRYCPMLDQPGVRERREAYRERDRVTMTEKLIEEMVAAGKLPDPSRFSIETVCGEAAD